MYFLLIIICLTTPTAGVADTIGTCDNSCSNSNSSSTSLYELYCCQSANKGKAIKRVENNRRSYIICPPEKPNSCPLESCEDILTRYKQAPSGYYDIQLSNGSVVSVYCDMEGQYCDNEGGWTRIAYLNMTQPNAVCPEGLEQLSFTDFSHDLCGRSLSQPNCNSASFDSYFIPYTRVCGQVRGYQYGHTDGLFDPSASIDRYVAGVSITYSVNQQRQHIWTYVSGENQDQSQNDDCPCNTGSSVVVPSFVGSDYYCESGHGTNLPNKVFPAEILFPNDVLWDGKNCDYLEGPCCTESNLPWFYKNLPVTTTSDIEVRVCGNGGSSGEDVPLDIIEIFVK